MTVRKQGAGITRRATLLLPLASSLAGCGLFDDWFGATKIPLPGTREPVITRRRTLEVDEAGKRQVTLPPPVANAAWPQAGGNPAHLMGHLAARDSLAEAWTARIGEGGGYRRKILAQPVVADGMVFTMDSDAVVTAFDARSGSRRWRAATADEDDDSTNVGGGLAWNEGLLYAANGLAELVAFDARNGQTRFRRRIGAPVRSAPTVAEGRLFVTTIEQKLLALAADDGRPLWTHQAVQATTTMLGQPAPAYANGLIVAGFGSGELAGLRAETGGVAWIENLASARGRSSLAELSAIRGLPVLSEGRAFAIGLGGLFVALDARSGRRLWEREVSGEDSPWVAGDWVFVISSDQVMAAVNATDGRVAWITDLPRWEDEEKQEDPLFWFGPVLVGDRLIAAGTNRSAVAVSPYTGRILGTQKLSGAASLGPVVADGTAYIVTDDATLLALR